MKKLYIIALLAMNSAFCISAMELEETEINKTKLDQLLLNKQLLDAIHQKKIDLEQIKFLLLRGADVHAKDKHLNTPLHNAAYTDNTDAIQLLLDAGAIVKIIYDFNNTPLHNAAYNGYINTIKLLLKNGAVINAVNSNGNTPLHTATYHSNTNAIKFLLENGSDVNAASKEGLTALHIAANKGNIDPINLLLGAGANVNAVSKYGETPLHYATEKGNKDATKLLIENDANVSAKDMHGRNSLHYAAAQDNTQAILQLLTGAAMPQEYIATTFSNNQANEKENEAKVNVSSLKKLALINIANNLKSYDAKDECFNRIINSIKELRKEIALVIPLNDVIFKQKLLAIIPGINDLKLQRLQIMKSFIETPNNANETALDIAKNLKNMALSKILQSIVDAQSFQNLPEDIKQKTDDSIIQVFLAGNKNFASAEENIL